MLLLSAIKIFHGSYSDEVLAHLVLWVTDGSHFHLICQFESMLFSGIVFHTCNNQLKSYTMIPFLIINTVIDYRQSYNVNPDQKLSFKWHTVFKI